MSQTPTTILREARGLLTENERARGVYARDKDGTSVASGHANAVHFCAIGALWRAANNLSASPSEYRHALGALYEEVGCLMSLAEWNDLATDNEVLGVFDRLLARVPVPA